MTGKRFTFFRRQFRRWVAAAILLTIAWSARPAWAQTSEPTASPIPTTAESTGVAPGLDPLPNGGVVQAGCSSCGGDGIFSGGCSSCGGGASSCRPGIFHPEYCCCNFGDSCVGRFFGGLYQCICCPDPCYVPQWTPVADSAFFVDAARPVTQMKLRWDTGLDLKDPDRAEFFWAREGVNQAAIPNCGNTGGFGKGPNCIPRTIDYESLTLVMEAAAGPAGIVIETPYEHFDVDPGAADALVSGSNRCCPVSGFEDIKIATKAMLLDCELMQLTFQFKTYIPSGDFHKGLGTGHVSLEPSLLFNVRVSADTYVQGQLSYWIPLGGDSVYESDIFHTHWSLNHVLWRPCPGITVVGTAELNEWSVLYGEYTIPDYGITINGKTTPVAGSAEATMVSAGPGIRAFFCDKIDLGVGTAFALTGNHWEEELIRAEFRWRF
jgi:hypothetical protein